MAPTLTSAAAALAIAGADELHQPGNFNDQYRTLQASGPGSVLDLRNIATVTKGPGA